MPTRLLNLLLLLALALSGVRLWRFTSEAPPGLPAAAPVTAGAPVAAAAPDAPAAEAPAESARAESYEVIVARDLFSPARGVVPPAPVVAAKAAAKPQPAPKLTLSGVVILDNERSAFLHEGGGEARPRKVKEGERFAGGTVSAIRPDGVTFQFGGAETFVPLRTPKDAPAPGGAVSAPSGTRAGDRRPAAQAAFPRRFGQPATQGPGRPGVPATARMPGVPQFVPPAQEPDEEMIEEEEDLSDDGEDEYLDEDLPADIEDDSDVE